MTGVVFIEWQGSRRERPPLVRISLRVHLRNDGADARWFLVPQQLPADESLAPGYYGLELATLAGTKGKATLATFEGAPAFHGFLLAPGSVLTVENLPLRNWGPVPAELGIRISTARRVWIGADDAETWVGASALCQGTAEVSAENRRTLHGRFTPDRAALPVRFEELRHIDVRIATREG